ncbi:hypothetical protein [Plasmodium yoelii yoelii]|uniref:Uncharacterized protein n=1 Tax=Plasmodium yoelii yoelii TaxID=73239 RepID=Q7RAR4_PLAYO|nr:hypothetical protein [Plasmodium yoelii yoelii]
MTFLIIGL